MIVDRLFVVSFYCRNSNVSILPSIYQCIVIPSKNLFLAPLHDYVQLYIAKLLNYLDSRKLRRIGFGRKQVRYD